MKAFLTLKADTQFPKWYEDTLATCRAIQLAEIMDPNYRPPDGPMGEVFKQKQAWMYAVFRRIILTTAGKAIVQEHRYDYDAQMVMRKLVYHAKQSTDAVLGNRKMLKVITTIRLDNHWTKPSIEFITGFDRLLENYNDQQTQSDSVLNDTFKKTLLQAAVSPIGMLRGVSDRESERVVQGGTMFTYEEYLTVLKSTAAIYDEGKGGRDSRRDARLISYIETQEPEVVDTDEENAADYLVNAVSRRMPGSSMDKETWSSLQQGTKDIWDKIDATDKLKILEYAKKRAQKGLEVNTHDIDASDGTPLEAPTVKTGQDDEPPMEPPNQDDVPTTGGDDIVVNNAIAEARGKPHPGDIRRMMSQRNGGKETKKVHVSHVNFHGPREDDDFHSSTASNEWNTMMTSYWESDSEDEEDFHQGGW